MATNNLTAGARTYHRTMAAANDVDVVTLDRSYSLVQVVNHDAATTLWVTLDRGGLGETQITLTPAANTAGVFYVGPNDGTLNLQDDPAGPASVVRLTATTAVSYSIMGF